MAHPQCHVRVSVSTNTRQEGRTSFHLDSLLMTRMRAPFSSFSRWLSDLSSVRTWEQGKNLCQHICRVSKIHVRCLLDKTKRVVQTITWHGVTKSECWQWLCGQNKKRSLPLALVWGDAMGGGHARHGASCKWESTASECEKCYEALWKSKRELLPRCGSCLSWGAVTKNNAEVFPLQWRQTASLQQAP